MTTEPQHDLEAMEAFVVSARADLDSAQYGIGKALLYAQDGVHRQQIERARLAIAQALSSLKWVEK